MINLEKTTGLPLVLGDDMSLEFGHGVELDQETKIELPRIKTQLKNQNADFPARHIYTVFNNIAKSEHREEIKAAGLSYDLIVIPPGMIDEEYIKTLGYYHPLKKNSPYRYPEVYEVVYGQVQFILQRASQDMERVSQVNLAVLDRGEKLLCAPGFGAVAVNVAGAPVVIGRWKARAATEIYDTFDARLGAAYYIIENKKLMPTGELETQVEYAPNLNYDQIPELGIVRQLDLPQFDLISSVSMYITGVKNLQNLEFLSFPEKYERELDPEQLYHYQKEKITVK